MTLPYQEAQAGERAMSEIQKILQRFGCQSFGSMMDFEKRELIVQFKYRDTPITVRASTSGYANAWLKEHPHSNKMKRSFAEHQQEAHRRAGIAVYSILRDWIKGQVTAIECGILSFEGAFLGQILLPSGRTILEHVQEHKLLPKPEGL